MGYFYIFGTIVFTVYGQLIIKARVMKMGSLPAGAQEKIIFLLKASIDPYILSGLLSAFIASLFWIAAMTKFDISYAYPFMSAAFVLVLAFSFFFFNEPITIEKILGIILIVLGIFITSRSI